MVYTYFDENKKRQPAAISDHEMNMFILVTSAGDKGLEFFADDCPEYQVGERVRGDRRTFQGSRRIYQTYQAQQASDGISQRRMYGGNLIHPALLFGKNRVTSPPHVKP